MPASLPHTPVTLLPADAIASAADATGSATDSATAAGGRQAGRTYSSDYSLSDSSLEAIQSGRGEYARVLADLGFTPPGCSPPGKTAGGGGGRPGGGSSSSSWMAHAANRHSENGYFFKAAICAGFYPSVLRVEHPPTKYHTVGLGAAGDLGLRGAACTAWGQGQVPGAPPSLSQPR